VCATPGLGLSCPLSAWRAEEIADWLEARRADLDRGSVHLGGWIDPRTDHVWLDLVTVVPEQLGPLAMALARANSQRAVFDLGRRRLVEVPECAGQPAFAGQQAFAGQPT
jgi:hypothetical protein